MQFNKISAAFALGKFTPIHIFLLSVYLFDFNARAFQFHVD